MKSLGKIAAGILRRSLGKLVPNRRRLAFNYRLARLAGVCEPELLAIERIGPNCKTAVDIGANEGLFTYRLAGLYESVQAFEINPVLADRLREVAPKHVTVHSVGLSAQEGAGTLRVPHVRNRQLHGWASLEADNCTFADYFTEVPVSLRNLDSFEFDNVAFLKVDIEGHELSFLEGAKQTILRNRPIVLIETRDANVEAVRTIFAELGYAERTAAELIGTAGGPGNYIFVPT
ncbi:MAG: hypothetical protein C0483_17505 [Pirellula sp.]|nr:hypothetical protein [Pirellula sp.]